MIKQGLQAFSEKRVLLLQGPAGPFFARLAGALRHTGAQVFKVNFNAGDWLFYPCGAFNYRGTMEEWPFWFESLIRRLQIDTILLFGDCRPIHRVARAIASQHGLEIGVFEEGYVRPDHITLERFGVNGYSQHSRNPEHYADQPADGPKAQPVGRTYWAMARCVFWYFTIGSLGKPFFRHYRHHRPLTLLEGLPWVRAAWRKQWYRWTERGIQEQLTGQWDQRYFLVPLQVFNDAQITAHAGFDSINHFIETVLRSFAQHAPAETILVFKHHPMARGHRNYAALIRRLARETGIGPRVRYIHDQHLPTLLDHARGVVVINSTVGLSALHHNAPTKVCGRAFYDMPGITYQGSLDKFWFAAPRAMPDRELYQRFRAHLMAETQLNGSFYKPLKLPGVCAGLMWPAPSKTDLITQGR